MPPWTWRMGQGKLSRCTCDLVQWRQELGMGRDVGYMMNLGVVTIDEVRQ